MKKITLSFSILVAAAIFVTSCNKKENPAPEADKEFDSSVDASYANTTVTDIDMICGFIGESSFPKFVAPAPGQVSFTVVNTPSVSSSITWAPNTKCMDGKTRSGSIVMTYSLTDINAGYYRDYGWIGYITLNNYIVDGWMVDDSTTFPASTIPRLTIKNTAAAANPNPATTKLKWSIEGYVKFTNVADPTKTMSWNGKLNKILTNTGQLVPPPTNLIAITWSLAVVEYEGTFKGFTPGNAAYTYSVAPETPLSRNYTCSPDKVIGITTTPSVAVLNSEFHPFIKGVATFTTGSKDPRAIDFGSEGSPCDNSGSITIRGISYKVDFKK